MSNDFIDAFQALKGVLAGVATSLAVGGDSPLEYKLVTRTPSPFPQHKGHPMDFATVRIGKAYVSFHLMPLYMCPPLNEKVSPALKKRMQGKTCFNFKAVPEPELIAGLTLLTKAALEQWKGRKWI